MNKAKIVGSGIAFAIMLVAGWEGLRTVGYADLTGIPTVCYGDTGPDVHVGQVVSADECRSRLNADVQVFWDEVDRLVVVQMRPREHIAFVSLAYNIGLAAFAGSTLLRYANGGNMAAACLEILRWDKARGRTVKGLTKRRKAEFEICIGQTAE